jgi:hypothetical protein
LKGRNYLGDSGVDGKGDIVKYFEDLFEIWAFLL